MRKIRAIFIIEVLVIGNNRLTGLTKKQISTEGAIIIDKKTLRQQQIKKLGTTAPETVLAEGQQLLTKLRQTEEWQQAQTIATTISSPIEVPTKQIIQAAIAEGKQVYLPKTMPKRQMAFLPFTSYDDLVVSGFGLHEPEYNEALVEQNPDLVLVPGLAFAADSNYRVGFGGGYYDRFLANYHGKTIALVPSAMHFDTADWKIDNFDIKIDKLIQL